MKQISVFITLWVTVLFLSACGGKSSTVSGSAQGDSIPLHYSSNLSLIDYEDYIVAQLRNPWDTTKILHTYVLVDKKQPLPQELPQGTLVRTPLSKAVIYSSVHCSLLKDLGALNSIGGVCDLKYIKLPEIEEGCRNGTITDVGDGMNPNIERIIDLHPDAILLSPFENSGGYGRVEKLNVPIIECADYMETSSLGRAEWMRFYADAGANYIFREDTHSGSLPYPFEVIFEKGQQTDFWLIRYNQPIDKTYKELEKEFAPYAGFRAFKERNIYGCNTNRVPFYEETPFHPDWLLKDLIKIFHPSLLEGYELRYYKKLSE